MAFNDVGNSLVQTERQNIRTQNTVSPNRSVTSTAEPNNQGFSDFSLSQSSTDTVNLSNSGIVNQQQVSVAPQNQQTPEATENKPTMTNKEALEIIKQNQDALNGKDDKVSKKDLSKELSKNLSENMREAINKLLNNQSLWNVLDPNGDNKYTDGELDAALANPNINAIGDSANNADSNIKTDLDALKVIQLNQDSLNGKDDKVSKKDLSKELSKNLSQDMRDSINRLMNNQSLWNILDPNGDDKYTDSELDHGVQVLTNDSDHNV